MNARAIRKKLMRSRRRVLWGQRAYMRLRLPMSVLSSPPPPQPDIPAGWKEGLWEGHWQSPDEKECIHISRSSCGVNPEEWDTDDMDEDASPTRKPLFIEQDEYGTWKFWTGHRSVLVGEDEKGEPIHEYHAIPLEMVAAYKAYAEWKDKLYYPGNGQVLDAFNEAGNSAKSVHWWVEGGVVTVEFGVKWFYADRKLRFCRDLSKAMKLAHGLGIRTRIV